MKTRNSTGKPAKAKPPKTKKLTSQEEQKLCRRIQRGKPEDRLAARNELVEANLPLATWFAHRYGSSELPLEDRIQECYHAIILAAEKFDSKRGRFAHFAGYFIRRQMQRARAADCIIPTPQSAFELIAPYCRTFDQLYEETGQIPTDAEIAAKLGWTDTQARLASFAADTRRSHGDVNLGDNEPTSDNDAPPKREESPSEFMAAGDDDGMDIRRQRLDAIRDHLDRLGDDQRQIMELWSENPDPVSIARATGKQPYVVTAIVKAVTESIKKKLAPLECHDDDD